MVDFKVVISNKEGKSTQKEISDPDSRNLIGKKLGEVIKGEMIGISGYEFQITGGSDYCGFPMRKDVQGMGRKKIFAVAGVGIRKRGKGQKQRKTVCGNTIHPRISQINLKILKEGKVNLFEGKVEKPKEGKAGKEEKTKEELKKEEKAAEKKREKEERAEQKVEEQKAEKKREKKKPQTAVSEQPKEKIEKEGFKEKQEEKK